MAILQGGDMKNKSFLAILWLVIGLYGLLTGGCTARAVISRGPQVTVPTATGGSKLRGIFPPNNVVVVSNATDGLIVITVYQSQYKPYQVRIEPGQQAELQFRQFFRGEALVVANVYNPASGGIEDTASRQFYLTDNGSQSRIYDWVIRKSSSQRIIY